MILIFLIREKLLTNKNSAKSLFVRKNLQVKNRLNRPDIKCYSSQTTSSRPQIFCKIGFLKSIAKLLRKYSFRCLFLTKFKCFYVNFLNFLRTRFLNNNNWDFVGTVIETLIGYFVANGYQWKWWDFLLTSVIFYSCLRISYDHLHLKVLSASIAAFRISLAISPHFVWISSKNFSFFIFQCFT